MKAASTTLAQCALCSNHSNITVPLTINMSSHNFEISSAQTPAPGARTSIESSLSRGLFLQG